MAGAIVITLLHSSIVNVAPYGSAWPLNLIGHYLAVENDSNAGNSGTSQWVLAARVAFGCHNGALQTGEVMTFPVRKGAGQ